MMTGLEVLVGATALAGIGWVNWYFFMAERSAAVASAAADGGQDLTVTVRGGYEPGVLQVRKGSQVRITFDRQETSGCSEEIVFPDFGMKRFLPAFEKTTIELKSEETGTFEFTCGMSMLRGRLIVTDEEARA